MKEYVCIIGLDEPESDAIRARLDVPVLARVTLPGIVVQDGQLWVETDSRPRFVPAAKLVYHAIYDNDFDFITGLAFWKGACLPNARAMLDCRLKLPCLVRALQHTRFGFPRGYATPHMRVDSDSEKVAKWGNWHCGENKQRFTGSWQGEDAAVIEPFISGQAVRVVMIGEQYWQIKLEGDDWLKSIHHAQADFMEIDVELLADTRHLKAAFGLDVIANDYMVAADGSRYLLEVNHIPNVTRFPAIWEAYLEYVVAWVERDSTGVGA
ncbi:MAG: hypothetical protein SF123_13445 [Chloroflexota bacterium]|nr:hypothetical protein [Chloroflexota bacterium]